VIDIGGGTTDYVVYSDGVIKHTGALALGGDHVSNDLGHGLKVPLSRAEKLKLEHGSALLDEAMKGRTLTLTNELGLPLKTINVEQSRRIWNRLDLRIICGRAFFFPAAARVRRKSRSLPSRFFRCQFRSARPIPSAA
jgi:hypothetical protein